MPRPRRHDQNQILDAAERVVARDGVLTINAIAKEAGVSKSTVLYDHASKRDLVAALVERTIKNDTAFSEACAAEFLGQPDAMLRGRITAVRQSPPAEGGNPAILSLIAALIQDGVVREQFRHRQNEIVATLISDARHPRAARLAWLALEGLKLQQHLEIHEWAPDERIQILHDIEELALSADVGRTT